MLKRLMLVAGMAFSITGCALGVVNALSVQFGYERETGLRYAEHDRGLLDIYVPKDIKSDEKRPVVLWFYGGSWTDGRRGQYKFAAESFVSEGFVVVVPDYRVYPEVTAPAFLEDGARALAWTHANIANYGGDPRNIFLAGHSAGGHIAASLNYDQRYVEAAGGSLDWIAGAVGLAGPYDFLPAREKWLQDIFGNGEAANAFDPIEYVEGNEPPMLMLHGVADDTVYQHNPVNLQAAVRKAGGVGEVKLYPDVSHVRILLGLARPLRGKPPVLEDSVAFMRSHMRE